jgi:hypothetical protein
VGLVDQVLTRDQEFQETATDELARRRLGPFSVAEGEDPSPLDSQLARERLREAREALDSRPARSPGLGRRLLVMASIVLVTALGVHWETGGLDLGVRFALHAWILAVVVGVVWTARRIRERIDHETFAFAAAFMGMVVLGLLTDGVLRALGGA